MYIDDAGISSKRKQDDDKMVERLRKRGFELTLRRELLKISGNQV